jgi:hypothetical protein
VADLLPCARVAAGHLPARDAMLRHRSHHSVVAVEGRYRALSGNPHCPRVRTAPTAPWSGATAQEPAATPALVPPIRPFLGYFFLLEDVPRVYVPVRPSEPYFPVDPVFKGASYSRAMRSSASAWSWSGSMMGPV